MLRFAIGLLALAACGDNAAGVGTPTASGIFPAEAFLGRRVRVELTGTDTNWRADDHIGVDFGADIALGTVSVASPTTLFVDLNVDDTALPGLHDVTITDGREVVTLTQAFLLEPPIAVHFEGNVAQGSVALFSITNHDFDAPFDTTSFASSAFDAPIFPNITIEAPVGVAFAVADVTPYTITGQLLVDVDAAMTGPIVVVSGSVDDNQRSPLGSSITVTPRACEAMTQPTVTHHVVLPFDSHCFAFAPTATPHAAQFVVDTDDANAAPRVTILPPSGHFADVLATATRTTEISTGAVDRYYAIYLDRRGASNYDYTLSAKSTTLTAVDELEPNGAGSPQVHAPPLLFQHATLANQADEDWITFALDASAIGHRIHVVTTGADPKTDTRVDVYDPSMQSLGGPSSDGNFFEDFTSTPILSAGTYAVKIYASQSVFFEPAHDTYDAAIFLE